MISGEEESRLAYLAAKAGLGLNQGSLVVFDCNLLHASGHNLSAQDRWQAYFCYNTVANRPVDVENPRPDWVRSRNWTPLDLVADDAIGARAMAPA